VKSYCTTTSLTLFTLYFPYILLLSALALGTPAADPQIFCLLELIIIYGYFLVNVFVSMERITVLA
jgi:hypothetical protein